MTIRKGLVIAALLTTTMASAGAQMVSAEAFAAKCKRLGPVKIGMTLAQAASKTCWGQGVRISRTETADHVLEILSYNAGYDRAYLRDGTVVAIQSGQ